MLSKSLTTDHRNHLTRAMRVGVKKAIAGAVLLGSVFFIAYACCTFKFNHMLTKHRYAANALAFWQKVPKIWKEFSGGGAGTVYAIVFLILDASFVIGAGWTFHSNLSRKQLLPDNEY